MGRLLIGLGLKVQTRTADDQRTGCRGVGLPDEPHVAPFAQRAAVETAVGLLIAQRIPAETDAFGPVDELQEGFPGVRERHIRLIPNTAVNDTAVAARAAMRRRCPYS